MIKAGEKKCCLGFIFTSTSTFLHLLANGEELREELSCSVFCRWVLHLSDYLSDWEQNDEWKIPHYRALWQSQQINKPHSIFSLFFLISRGRRVNEANFDFKPLLIYPITNRGHTPHQCTISLKEKIEKCWSLSEGESNVNYMLNTFFTQDQSDIVDLSGPCNVSNLVTFQPKLQIPAPSWL